MAVSLARRTKPGAGRLPRRRGRASDGSPQGEALTAGALYDIALHGASLYVDKRNAQDVRRLIQPWQARSMSYYDLVPEVKFAAHFMSQMLRRVRLFPAMVDPDTHEPKEVDSGPLFNAFERIKDRSGGRAELQASYGKQKFLIGETYLTVSPDVDRGEVWECLSPNELRVQPGGLASRFRAPMLSADSYIIGNDPAHDGEGPQFTDQGSDIINVYRLWRPHPAYSFLADCSMQAAVDILEELVLSTYSVRAQLKSRLNNGGILWIPDELSFTVPGNDPEEDPNSDEFQGRLQQTMMAAISDPGSAAAFVPIVSRIAGEWIGKIQHTKFNDTAGSLAEISQRTEMVERFAVSAELPPELFKSMEAVNHWCVDTDTEILTADGWMTQEQLVPGAEVLTLNHTSGLSEWQPVEDVARFEVDELPMMSLETRFHSSLSTFNHRWPVLTVAGRDRRTIREWRVSEDLCSTNSLVTAAYCADVPTEPIHSDAFVELAAWMWTEGGITYREGRLNPKVHIYQSHSANYENVQRIRRALESEYGAGARVPMPSSRRGPLDPVPRWREVATENGRTAFSLNVAAAAPLVAIMRDRCISLQFMRELTQAQLELFLEVSVLGDGHLMNGGTQTIAQGAPERLAAFEFAAILAGRSSHQYTYSTLGFTRHTMHHISLRRRQTVKLTRHRRMNKPKTVRYTGTIWCPVTANHSWLARRNGHVFFTGNTGWLVDDQTWDSYGMPATLEMANDINAAYLQPTARDELGMADWDQVCIGYDAADVINKPDNPEDAMALFNALSIGKKSLRERYGYDDDDAMPDNERAEQIGIKTRDSSLAWDEVPSVKAGGLEPSPGVVEHAGDATETAPVAKSGDGVSGDPGPPADAAVQVASAVVDIQRERVLGAAEFAVERARELAGSRVRAMTSERGPRDKRCADCQEALDGVPNWDVCSTLGHEQLQALSLAPAELVAGSSAAFASSLNRMSVHPDWAVELAGLVEQHAARTLCDPAAPPLPAAFGALLARLSTPLERV